MNGLVIITNKQKLLICVVALLFIIMSAFLITRLDFPKAAHTVSPKNSKIMSPENENQHLKDILSSILPAENIILYENSSRELTRKSPEIKLPESQASEIIAKGKKLPYLFVFSDEEYLRPIYTNLWKQSFYQGWLYLPRKVISSRHNLFTYSGGAGKVFDIEGQLGFYPNVTIDNQNYFNFLIYNFELENVSQLGNDIALSGKPVKKGVQIVSVKIDDVAPLINEKQSITAHLCTPAGYEIDYQNIPFSKDSNRIEDFGPVQESYTESSYNGTDLSSMEISQQNTVLRKELAFFVSDSTKPIYFQPNGTYQTDSSPTETADIEEALDGFKAIKFSFLYNNKKYAGPVYHPGWKEHYDRDWCYIPRKMYLNMKWAYVLPPNKEVTADLLGELGFFEKFSGVPENQTGIAVKNFTVSKAGIFEDNILLVGTPARAGMQIVGIDKKNLTGLKEYTVRLVTSDACEIDSDILKY